MDAFPNVKTLILDRNAVVTLESFPVMASVKILSLEKNKLEEVYETIKYLKQKFPSVQSLNLLANPLNPKTKSEEYAIFRNRIRDNIESVSVLDGAPIERMDNENDPVAIMLREAHRKKKEEKVGSKEEDKKGEVKGGMSITKEDPKESKVMVKKKTVVKTTIDNLSERILKSHSEGNRFITNDDL